MLSFDGGPDWYFSAVYENNKRILWDELFDIANTMQGPWLVAGGLNDVLGSHECKGRDGCNPVKARRFADRLDI